MQASYPQDSAFRSPPIVWARCNEEQIRRLLTSTVDHAGIRALGHSHIAFHMPVKELPLSYVACSAKMT